MFMNVEQGLKIIKEEVQFIFEKKINSEDNMINLKDLVEIIKFNNLFTKDSTQYQTTTDILEGQDRVPLLKFIRINKIMDSKESKMLFELHLKESRRDQSLMRIQTKITIGLLIRIQMKFKKNNTNEDKDPHLHKNSK